MLARATILRHLAPGVRDELKRVTPRNEGGRRKSKFFQHLTTNVGYPELREHLGSVVTLMKLSDNWADFQEKLNRIHPRLFDNYQLNFEFETGIPDDGTGL